jgi:hypothetical protein
VALNRETLAIVGLGGAGFAYWYWKRNQNATSAPASTSDTVDNGATGGDGIYIPSYDLAANNVAGASQIYGQGTSGLTGPGVSPSVPIAPASGVAGPIKPVSSGGMRTTTTNGQAMALPVQS